jgi:hypothetical protein
MSPSVPPDEARLKDLGVTLLQRSARVSGLYAGADPAIPGADSRIAKPYLSSAPGSPTMRAA